MKVTIPIETLATALKAVVPAVGRRSTLPILAGVMIEQFADAAGGFFTTGADHEPMPPNLPFGIGQIQPEP